MFTRLRQVSLSTLYSQFVVAFTYGIRKKKQLIITVKGRPRKSLFAVKKPTELFCKGLSKEPTALFFLLCLICAQDLTNIVADLIILYFFVATKI